MTTATNTSSYNATVTALANARLDYDKCRLAYNDAAAAQTTAILALLSIEQDLKNFDSADSAEGELNPFAVAGEVVETEDEAIASRASEDASAYLRDRILDNAY